VHVSVHESYHIVIAILAVLHELYFKLGAIRMQRGSK